MTAALGAIRFDLQAMTAKFEEGMKRASKDLGTLNTHATRTQATLGRLEGTLSKTAGKVGAAINIATGAFAGLLAIQGVGGFVRQMNQASQAVDTLGKRSAMLGMSVEDLSAWRFAAQESGVEVEALEKQIGKLQKGLGEFALTGKGPAKDALRRLGVQAMDTRGQLRPVSELLPEIARAFERVGSQGEKISLAASLFGRTGGEEFVQFLEDSGGFMKNLADQTARAKALGVVFTDRQVNVLKAYNDALGRVKEAWLGVRVRIMTEVAPALTAMANSFALKLARMGELAADFGTVLSAAFQKIDVVSWMDGGGFNVAANALRGFVGSLANVVWTEVNTRIRSLVARVWTTIGVLLKRLGGVLGPALSGAWDAIAEFFGMVWAGVALLAQKIADVLGPMLAAVAKFFREIGSELASAWAEAGQELQAFNDRMQEQRSNARAWFATNLSNVSRLAEKYRQLGDAAEHAGARMAGMVGPGTSIPRVIQGMQAGLAALKDQYSDTFNLGEDLVRSFTENASSGFAKALSTGELSFRKFGRTASSVLNGVLEKIADMILQFMFARAITAGLSGLSGLFGQSQVTSTQLPLAFSTQAHLEPFAEGGRFTEPTLLLNSKGAGIMAERGPEWIVPEGSPGARVPSGRGGGVQVVVIDQRQSGARPEVSSGTSPDGRQMIRIIVRDEVGAAIRDGSLDKPLGVAYGVRRGGRPS